MMQGHRGGGGGGGGEGGRGRVGGGGRAHTCIMTHMAGNGGKRRLPGVRTAAGSERKINKASANVHVRGEGRVRGGGVGDGDGGGGAREEGLLGWKPLMFQIHALTARCVYGKNTGTPSHGPC